MIITSMTTRTNPFECIYKKCNRGHSKEKLKNLMEFPAMIDIELTNKCNFKCLMCPTGTHMQKRHKGFMERSTFDKILNQTKDYKTPFRFIRWGEPLLHNDIIDFIQKAKDRGHISHLNTNGSLLDEDMVSALLDIPLDSIKFSFQGVDKKSYHEMRNIDFFNELVQKIKHFFLQRAKKELPFIDVSTTITYENKDQVEKFIEKVKPFTDHLTIGRTVLEHIDLNQVATSPKDKEAITILKEKESVVKKHPECPEVFDKLSINWDGSVSACCADFDNLMTVGHINQDDLKTIWHSKKMHAYRVLLADMKHDKLKLCKTCYDYHGLENPELQNLI